MSTESLWFSNILSATNLTYTTVCCLIVWVVMHILVQFYTADNVLGVWGHVCEYTLYYVGGSDVFVNRLAVCSVAWGWVLGWNSVFLCEYSVKFCLCCALAMTSVVMCLCLITKLCKWCIWVMTVCISAQIEAHFGVILWFCACWDRMMCW